MSQKRDNKKIKIVNRLSKIPDGRSVILVPFFMVYSYEKRKNGNEFKFI